MHQQHWDVCDPAGVATTLEDTCRSFPGLASRSCASARGISECNQIATVLGLPDTTPETTLSMHMPSGCVWQKSTSQLSLNQLVDAINASDPTQTIVMKASPEHLELCSCATAEEFFWVAGNWQPCYRLPNAHCHGVRQRTRHVFCLRKDLHIGSWMTEVVADSSCTSAGPRPVDVEQCSGCGKEILLAVVEFNLPEEVPDLQAPSFAQALSTNLIQATGLDSDLMSLGSVSCCDGTYIKAEILVSDAGENQDSAVAAVERLLNLARSANLRNGVAWTDGFASFAPFLSVQVLGSYSWAISDAWGPCSKSCGEGVETRDVWCSFSDWMDPDVIVTGMICNTHSKPPAERSCATQLCKGCPAFVLGPQYAVSGGNRAMSHGSVVYVTCAAGYATSDDIPLVESECQDGTWTPLAVSCGQSCPAFQTDTWKYMVQGKGLQHGSTRHITCRNQNFTSLIESAPSSTVICQDGTWTSPLLACTGDCQSPEFSSAYAISGVSSDEQSSIFVQDGAVWYIACAQGFNSSKGQAPAKLECVEGNWFGLDSIPECYSDCPRYTLAEGYEVDGPESEAAVIRSSNDASSLPTSSSSGAVRRMNSTDFQGVPHHTSIGIRCVEGYGGVPGAVEAVVCNDGQWSPLSLFCEKDCKPFNASSVDAERFRIVMDMSRPNTWGGDEADGNSAPAPLENVPHGSKVVIGCNISGLNPDEPRTKERASRRGEIRCENGQWTVPDIRCFNDCPPYDLGRQYSVLVPGVVSGEQVSRSAPHGTQLLATCARGYSTMKHEEDDMQLQSKNLSTASRDALIVEAECVDGSWTGVSSLMCLPDCPPIPREENMLVDTAGGFQAGSAAVLSCAADAEKKMQIRCGMAGSWETDGTTESLETKMKKMGCPPFVAEDSVRQISLWTKLSDDERALFMIMVLGCLAAVCGLGGRWLMHSDLCESSEDEVEPGEAQPCTEDGDGERLPGDPDATRTFNLLESGEEFADRRPGSVRKGKEKRRRRRRRSRLYRAGQAVLQRVLDAAIGHTPPPCGVLGCERLATQMCFPCSHVCLCLPCAQELMRSVASQGMCPVCEEKMLCVIDAQPSGVFTVASYAELTLQAAGAAVSKIRSTFEGDSRRSPNLAPTVFGRARAGGARRAAAAPPVRRGAAASEAGAGNDEDA